MRLVTREQWGARPPKQRSPFYPTQPSTAHWNGPTLKIRGEVTWGHEFCSAIVRGIQNFHMDQRKWSDIAYNWLECPHGYTYEGRGLKYQNGANGTNTANRTSPAVCYLGGEGNPFTDEAKVGFNQVAQYVASNSSAKPGMIGHRDHKSTACPGDVIYRWVKSGMPVKYVDFTEQDMSFESHAERENFVKKCYKNIAKRVPSEEEVAWWVYVIAYNPTNALNLMVDLEAERP